MDEKRIRKAIALNNTIYINVYSLKVRESQLQVKTLTFQRTTGIVEVENRQKRKTQLPVDKLNGRVCGLQLQKGA